MLFGSNMLEVAIGVIFVYLLVSLLCSALNELIEAFLQYRATNLAKGIKKLLGNDELAEELLNHPLVKPLGEHPSYITSRTFSLALWNMATTAGAAARALKEGESPSPPKPGETPPPPKTVADDVKAIKGVTTGVTQNIKEIRSLIEELDDKRFKNIKVSLLTLMDEAGNDMKKARENVENWYDDAMDRVSGWYKRRAHKHLIYIGLIAAVVLNIDTINITKALLYNDTLRASVAQAAETYVKENPAPSPSPAAPDTNANVTTTTNTATNANTNTTANTNANSNTNTNANRNTNTNTNASGTTSESPAEAAARRKEERQRQSEEAEEKARLAKEKIARVRGELESLGLPIGWWLFAPVEPKESDFMTGNQLDATGLAEARARYEKERIEYPSDPRRLPSDPMGVLLKLVGLFITGLAVSQGAPFWFDVLNKFIVIRSTVKPREKSQDQPSKDTTTKPKKPKDEEDESDNSGNSGGGGNSDSSDSSDNNDSSGSSDSSDSSGDPGGGGTGGGSGGTGSGDPDS